MPQAVMARSSRLRPLCARLATHATPNRRIVISSTAATANSEPEAHTRLRSFLIVFGAWTLVGLFYLSQDASRRSFFGDPRPWQETIYWAVRVYVSAAFTPWILWLGRRWPIERPHLLLRSLGHVLAAAAYAFLEV